MIFTLLYNDSGKAQPQRPARALEALQIAQGRLSHPHTYAWRAGRTRVQ